MEAKTIPIPSIITEENYSALCWDLFNTLRTMMKKIHPAIIKRSYTYKIEIRFLPMDLYSDIIILPTEDKNTLSFDYKVYNGDEVLPMFKLYIHYMDKISIDKEIEIFIDNVIQSISGGIIDAGTVKSLQIAHNFDGAEKINLIKLNGRHAKQNREKWLAYIVQKYNKHEQFKAKIEYQLILHPDDKEYRVDCTNTIHAQEASVCGRNAIAITTNAITIEGERRIATTAFCDPNQLFRELSPMLDNWDLIMERVYVESAGDIFKREFYVEKEI